MPGPQETPLFTPQGGGLGAYLACTDVSSRVALPSPLVGSVFCVQNLDADPIFMALGNVSAVATTSYFAVQPGVTYIGIPNARGSSSPSYVAGICAAGITARLQITAGNLE